MWLEIAIGLAVVLLLTTLALAAYAVDQIHFYEEPVPAVIEDSPHYQDMVEWVDSDDVYESLMTDANELIEAVHHPPQANVVEDSSAQSTVSDIKAKIRALEQNTSSASSYNLSVLDLDGTPLYGYPYTDRQIVFDDRTGFLEQKVVPLAYVPHEHDMTFYNNDSLFNIEGRKFIEITKDVLYAENTNGILMLETGIKEYLNDTIHNIVTGFEKQNSKILDITEKFKTTETNINVKWTIQPFFNVNDTTYNISKYNDSENSLLADKIYIIYVYKKIPEEEEPHPGNFVRLSDDDDTIGIFTRTNKRKLVPSHIMKAMLSSDGRGVSTRTVRRHDDDLHPAATIMSLAERVHPDQSPEKEAVGYVIITKIIEEVDDIPTTNNTTTN